MLQLAGRYAERNKQEWAPLFYTILQSRIRDWHRRSRVRNRLRSWLNTDPDDDSDPIAQLPDSNTAGPADRVAMARATDVLEAALRRLPLRQQQAFLLRVWEGLDVADTARAMGCTEGSVKTHYSRAVHSLRENLEDHWP